MAPRPKLTDAQVSKIRDRVRNGERKTDLADEFHVNRKTIGRRIDDLDRSETEKAEESGRTAERRQGSSATDKRETEGSPPSEPSPQAPVELLPGVMRDVLLPSVFANPDERLAYYALCSLESHGDWLNYRDALRGDETPDELRAREQGKPLQLRSYTR